MERIADLTAILQREMAGYVWEQDDSNAYLLKDDARRMSAVLIVPKATPQESLTIIVAHLTEDNMVVIDTDLTDKPLYKALLQAGVRREQIVRAYAENRCPSERDDLSPV